MELIASLCKPAILSESTLLVLLLSGRKTYISRGNIGEIFEWFKGEFERAYYGNRAPITFLVGAAWFQILEGSLQATQLYVTKLKNTEHKLILKYC